MRNSGTFGEDQCLRREGCLSSWKLGSSAARRWTTSGEQPAEDSEVSCRAGAAPGAPVNRYLIGASPIPGHARAPLRSRPSRSRSSSCNRFSADRGSQQYSPSTRQRKTYPEAVDLAHADFALLQPSTDTSESQPLPLPGHVRSIFGIGFCRHLGGSARTGHRLPQGCPTRERFLRPFRNLGGRRGR